jgi:glycosyltransferase involved in cell wall biosynthesis
MLKSQPVPGFETRRSPSVAGHFLLNPDCLLLSNTLESGVRNMKTGANPARRVSVVMPVRNALPYLDASITSILEQSFADFEFIIGDDGSTDGSRARLIEWSKKDDRIRLFLGEGGGLGPAGSSNWVAGLATFPLVARMDADDVSGRCRLEAEVAALDADAGAVLVGSVYDCIDRAGRVVRQMERHSLHDPYSARHPFPHGSVMYRREAFETAGGYRASCDFWEDIDLYWRMAKLGRLLVLPEVHYSYRFNSGHSRLKAHRRKVEVALDLALRCSTARRNGEEYERLLTEALPAQRRLRPSVFRMIGQLELWSGARPKIIPRLVMHGKLRFNRETISAIAWAIWAFVSPHSLRTTAKWIARRRERHSAEVLSQPVEWRPMQRPE